MRVSTPNLFSTRTEIVCRIAQAIKKPAFRAGTAGDLPALRQSLGSRQSITTTLATRKTSGNRFIAGGKLAIGKRGVNRHFHFIGIFISLTWRAFRRRRGLAPITTLRSRSSSRIWSFCENGSAASRRRSCRLLSSILRISKLIVVRLHLIDDRNCLLQLDQGMLLRFGKQRTQ